MVPVHDLFYNGLQVICGKIQVLVPLGPAMKGKVDGKESIKLTDIFIKKVKAKCLLSITMKTNGSSGSITKTVITDDGSLVGYRLLFDQNFLKINL
jgi:hypothetical protein